jgi:hypothetical protein
MYLLNFLLSIHYSINNNHNISPKQVETQYHCYLLANIRFSFFFSLFSLIFKETLNHLKLKTKIGNKLIKGMARLKIRVFKEYNLNPFHFNFTIPNRLSTSVQICAIQLFHSVPASTLQFRHLGLHWCFSLSYASSLLV